MFNLQQFGTLSTIQDNTVEFDSRVIHINTVSLAQCLLTAYSRISGEITNEIKFIIKRLEDEQYISELRYYLQRYLETKRELWYNKIEALIEDFGRKQVYSLIFAYQNQLDSENKESKSIDYF